MVGQGCDRLGCASQLSLGTHLYQATIKYYLTRIMYVFMMDNARFIGPRMEQILGKLVTQFSSLMWKLVQSINIGSY